MSEAVANSTTAELLETVAQLRQDQRQSVLSFALFLRSQEEERRLAEEDAQWDASFSDPVRMAKFKAWIEESKAEGIVPMDFSKL